jgi:hypothetical protein
MKRVEVWLMNGESSRSVHEHFGQIVEAYIPARVEFLGMVEATPEAVAELADVEIEEAAPKRWLYRSGCRNEPYVQVWLLGELYV